MLCTPVFIFTSGSPALLGRPCCGLSIWLSLLVIFNTLLRVYANLFHEKTDKTLKYSKSAIFVWYKNGRRRLLGAQSTNTERASLTTSNDMLSLVKIRKRFLRFKVWGDYSCWGASGNFPQLVINSRKSITEYSTLLFSILFFTWVSRVLASYRPEINIS